MSVTIRELLDKVYELELDIDMPIHVMNMEDRQELEVLGLMTHHATEESDPDALYVAVLLTDRGTIH